MSSSETTWGFGDYPLMARHLRPATVAAVDAGAVLASERVVDVATGTGNAALVAAERGGQAIGVDFEPALLRLAEQRAGTWAATFDGFAATWQLCPYRMTRPTSCFRCSG